MVSKASEDLPDPERPVSTTRASRGSVSETFLRLCSRAPVTTIWFADDTTREFYRGEQMFGGGRVRCVRQMPPRPAQARQFPATRPITTRSAPERKGRTAMNER